MDAPKGNAGSTKPSVHLPFRAHPFFLTSDFMNYSGLALRLSPARINHFRKAADTVSEVAQALGRQVGAKHMQAQPQ